jgi:hypothetical protein
LPFIRQTHGSLALLFAQTTQSRLLNGCIAIVLGIAVIVFARTDAASRAAYRVWRAYSGERTAAVLSRYMPYAYQLGGAVFIAVGLLAVTGVID